MAYKGAANSASFLSRTGSHSTKGSRRGVVNVRLPESDTPPTAVEVLQRQLQRLRGEVAKQKEEIR